MRQTYRHRIISGYRSNEHWNVNTTHLHLVPRSRMVQLYLYPPPPYKSSWHTQQVTTERAVFVSVYCVYSVSTDNTSMWIREVLYLVHEGNGLRLSICAFYLWKMVLNVGHDVWIENMDEKGIKERTWTVNSTEAYTYYNTIFPWIFTGCYISYMTDILCFL
jgi:hypothetical protein